MANNRMYLVNRRTGVRAYLAKYYPSCGWSSWPGIDTQLNAAFEKSDFGHLSPAELDAKRKQTTFGPPYANYSANRLWFGDEWVIEYEIDSPASVISTQE